MWVLINSMVANNDEVQRLGCVHLVHMLDDMPTKINFFDTLRYGNQLLRYNPIRFEATFTLVQGTNATDSPWKNVIDFMNYICGRNLRLRSRVIYGKCDEAVLMLVIAVAISHYFVSHVCHSRSLHRSHSRM